MIYLDKDRPSTWTKYKEGMCQGCIGSCCTMPVEVRKEDLLRLELANEDDYLGSHKKLVKRLIKEKIIVSYREASGLYMLAQKPNSDCGFMDSKTRLCTVYEKRPQVCRDFPRIGPRPGYCPVNRKK